MTFLLLEGTDKTLKLILLYVQTWFNFRNMHLGNFRVSVILTLMQTLKYNSYLECISCLHLIKIYFWHWICPLWWLILFFFYFLFFSKSYFIYFFKFYFIFKLYNIVLVLPNIEMNPPQRKRNTTQMKVQIRNTEVQINEKEIGKLPEKRIQNNDSKDDQNPWKQNGEKA